MRPGGRDQGIALGGHVSQTGPQPGEILDGLAHGGSDLRGDLDSRLEELRLDPPLVLLVVVEGKKDLVDAGDELVALPPNDLELFLDS